MSSASLSYAGRILALVGGILMILFAVLALLGWLWALPFSSPLRFLNIFGHDFIILILGIISVIGSRYCGRLVWSIVLIVIGYIGNGIGGLLVLVGGILGLVSYLLKKH